MVEPIQMMGVGEHSLPELKGKTKEHLTSVLDRARETGLLTHLGGTYYTIHPALPWGTASESKAIPTACRSTKKPFATISESDTP